MLAAHSLKVGQDLIFENVTIDGRVNIVNSDIGARFVWKRVISRDIAKLVLDLRDSGVGVLCDAEKSWPKDGNLFLQGLTYRGLSEDALKSVNTRIAWLQLQPGFQADTYVQLADVLRKSGHEETATRVLIEKNRERRRKAEIGHWSRFGLFLYGLTTSYGYRPSRTLWFITAFIVLGTLVFRAGFAANVMVATNIAEHLVTGAHDHARVSKDHPKPSAFVYSLDSFIPLLDLRHAKYWQPKMKAKDS